MASEDEIRALMDERANAARSKDVDRIMAQFAPNVRSYEFAPPLQILGAGAVREICEQGYAAFPGTFEFETRDLHITAGDDVAFCYGFDHIRGTTHDGVMGDVWTRATTCFRKIDGKWLITHQHLSVPADLANGKAYVDLEP
jgi:ketosteroid isomerase-like protein